jgi:hypothetical protein
LLAIAAVVVMLAESASALPVFARRYATSCTTCHAIIPKLNPFGVAFRNNGYRIPAGEEQLVVPPDVSLGAPDWKKIWPKAVWPGAIPGMPPLAFRAAADAMIAPSQPLQVNFNFPSFLAMYFAGPAGDTVSYFGQVALAGSPATVNIDRAYAQFRLSPERRGSNWLMLKVGKIDNRAEPFSSTFRKTTAANFNVSDYRVIAEGFGLRDRNPGIEAWGAATGPDNRGGLEYAFGLMQGISLGQVNEYASGPGSAIAKTTFNSKDYYWNASYKFGGLGVVGSREEKEHPNGTHNYAEKSILLGTYGYRGKRPSDVMPGVDADEFRITGAKVDAYYGNLNVYGAVAVGRDALKGSSAQTIHSSAFFVESDYMVFPWVMPLVRFEKTNFSDGRRNVKSLVPAVNFAIRANARVLVEGHFFNHLNAGGTVRSGVNQAVVRLDFAF